MSAFSIRVLLLAVFLLCTGRAGAAVIISEFQADNEDTTRDDDGDRSDWIELHNPDTTTASLAGMSLSNDPAQPQRWVFPAGVAIPAGGHLLVWASEKDRRVATQPLHTNFKLEADGGYLALRAADGSVLTEFSAYPAQPADRSWGSGFPRTTIEVVPRGAPCRWLVPSAAITNWQTLTFNDSAWTAARTAIGYDSDSTASGVNYLPFIGENGNVQSRMYNITGRTSVFIRIPFTVQDPALVRQMFLTMWYDDGFAAWINGVRLSPPASAQSNVPATLLWDSAALAARNNLLAAVPAGWDVSAQRTLLLAGANVLAIQGLNSAITSTDLLMLPVLSLVTATAAPAGPGYYATPSPGALNTGTPAAGFTDAPDFSIKRGTFSAPFDLTLTTNTPGAAIRYTTDGSSPLDGGTAYTAPLRITTTTVVRAAAFRDGWEPSVVKSHSYIFPRDVLQQPAAPPGLPAFWGNEYNFSTGGVGTIRAPADYRMDPGVTQNPAYSAELEQALAGSLPILSIAANSDDIFDFNQGIYSNGRWFIIEVPISMEYWNPADPTGRERWQENAGLRIHGGDALIEHPKKPFRIYFRKEYGTDKLRHRLYPDSPVEEFNKLQLRGCGHDGWAVPFGSGSESLAAHASYLRDRFLRQCELDMGRLVHRGRYLHLYLNGLYWGIYDLHEVIDANFFADHKGGEPEDWDVIEQQSTTASTFDTVDGTGDAMNAALALVRPPQQLLDQEKVAELRRYVPFEEFIDNLIVQMWGAQNDWLGPVFRGTPGVDLTDASRFINKNWQAGRRSRGTAGESGFFWQTWDAEISMGNSLTALVRNMRVTNFNHTLIGTPETDIDTASNMITPAPAAEIYNALRKHSPLFRRLFADRLQKHFFNGGALSTPLMQERLMRLRKQLDMPMAAEGARWGDVNTGDPVAITFTRDTHWRPEVDWLHGVYIPQRAQTLLQQFAAIGLWPADAGAPVFSSSGGSVPAGFQLTITPPPGSAQPAAVYYTLDGSDPAEPLPARAVELLSPASPSRYRVPTAAQSSNTWQRLTPPADLASWLPGTAALGFDAGTAFTPHFTTTVAGMSGVSTSCYLRIPFTAPGKWRDKMTALTLSLKYDDGCIVFLNSSTAILRLNAPAATPAWNTAASAPRLDTDAVAFSHIDLTSRIPALLEENVLSLQGLTTSTTDVNFLCAARLTATLEDFSPSAAREATGPIPLTDSVTVKARTLVNGEWSPLIEASFIVGVPASAANLTISEFNYNPAPPTAAESAAGFSSAQMFEFIELYNISANAVQLGGCRFDDGIAFDFTAHSSVLELAPGQRLILASHADAFRFRYPGVPVAGVFQNSSALSNGGERLEFLSASGAAIFDFAYDDAAPWPIEADGGGFSLVLRSPETAPDVRLPANWRASLTPGGAPGAADTGETFAAWAAAHAPQSQPADDPDGDGVPCLIDYALGRTTATPLLEASMEIVPAIDPLHPCLVVRYQTACDADDVSVTAEMSTGLQDWTPLTATTVPPVFDPVTRTRFHTVHSPVTAAEAAALFVRLRVQLR